MQALHGGVQISEMKDCHASRGQLSQLSILEGNDFYLKREVTLLPTMKMLKSRSDVHKPEEAGPLHGPFFPGDI